MDGVNSIGAPVVSVIQQPLYGIGAMVPLAATPVLPEIMRPAPVPTKGNMVLWALAAAGTTVGAYHGYKRNNSVGWGVGWAILGGIAPFIVLPIVVAQGLGKRKK